MNRDLSDYRKTYSKNSLDENNLIEDPFKLFEEWFSDADKYDGIEEANAMTLSTLGVDGFLKNRDNYEIINPEDVGLDSSSIDLTARSGRAALKPSLSLLGYEFSKIELETLYVRFIELADEKKLLHDEDLIELVKEKNG